MFIRADLATRRGLPSAPARFDRCVPNNKNNDNNDHIDNTNNATNKTTNDNSNNNNNNHSTVFGRSADVRSRGPLLRPRNSRRPEASAT